MNGSSYLGKSYISDHLTLSPTKYESKSVGMCVDSNPSTASVMTPSGFLLGILAYHKRFCVIFFSRVVRMCIAAIISLSFICPSVLVSVRLYMSVLVVTFIATRISVTGT